MVFIRKGMYFVAVPSVEIQVVYLVPADSKISSSFLLGRTESCPRKTYTETSQFKGKGGASLLWSIDNTRDMASFHRVAQLLL